MCAQRDSPFETDACVSLSWCMCSVYVHHVYVSSQYRTNGIIQSVLLILIACLIGILELPFCCTCLEVCRTIQVQILRIPDTTHTCMHTCTHAHTHMRTHVCARAHTRAHTHINTHEHECTNTHRNNHRCPFLQP